MVEIKVNAHVHADACMDGTQHKQGNDISLLHAWIQIFPHGGGVGYSH